MADEVTATGFTIDDYATRLAIIVGELRTNISAILDVSEDQPTGQIVRILTEHEQQLAELLQEVYSGIDPDQATGQTLDAICSMTGTYRNAATFGTVVQACTFTGAGVVLAAGTQVAVSGDPDNIWEIVAPFTSTGVGPENVNFQSTTAGAVPALINTITVIVTPVAGWVSTINSGAAATTGLDRETDTELRLRREVEITTGGSTSVDAVAAALSAMTGMLEVIVYENDDWRTVAPMPPHSIEAVYWDGGAAAVTPADLIEEIFEEKAGGIHAYGSTYLAHVDSQGNSHQIGYTLASEQVLQVRYTLTTNSDYPGNAAFSTAVAAAANADPTQLGIGEDVIYLKYYDYAFNVAGVLDITHLNINLAGAGWVAVNAAVGARQIATLIAGNVTHI
jgi:hypothetical protein